MKCVVIYFSLTGNTEMVAQAIQLGVKQAAGNCDIFPIKEANPRRLREYDLIGFGFPVMAAPSLQNVADFVKDMVFVGGKHAFQFNTADSGSVSPAIIPKLRKRGLVVIGWASWLGAGYGPLAEPTPSSSDGHPDEIDLQEAEDLVEKWYGAAREFTLVRPASSLETHRNDDPPVLNPPN